MLRQSPHIIGIAGGSCAGKSWLAHRLGRALGRTAIRISLDDFYLDRSHLTRARRARLNFDHPRAVDWPRFEQVLSELLSGGSASVPRYDFETHSRLTAEFLLPASPFIIVEGLWLFRRPALRSLFATKIFIRSEAGLRVERRLRRDTTERGRTTEQVLRQWERHTEPMFHQFVAPQERWADVVLDAPVQEKDVISLAERIAGQTNHTVIGI